MILDWTTLLLLMSAATPILLAALGEAVVERAGVLNLGVEGMMITGALAGFALAHATGSPALGFLGGALAGAALSMIFAVLTQYLLTNQVATGLALTLFGLGLTAMFGKPYEGVKAPTMPGGPLGINWVIWAGLALVPLIWLALNRTRPGLILRAVGENHDAAHALGYKVRAVRVAAIALGGALAGLGGALGLELMGVDPAYPLRLMALFLMVVAVGGTEGLAGPLMAALLIGVADTAGKYYLPALGGVTIYLVMIAALVLRPQGLAGRRA